MQFNLRRTLHSTPVRHREEVSSLLQTTVAANADCHVGCAGPRSTRSELVKLNLKPALRPMGIPTAIAPPSTNQDYAPLGSNDGPARLPATARLGCGLCVCCILIGLGLGGVFAYGALKPKTSLIDKVVAPPPPPPYEFVPLWGKLTRSGGSGKLVAKRPIRKSSPPPPLSRRRSPPPPPPAAALPDSELVLDILEHGTGE